MPAARAQRLLALLPLLALPGCFYVSAKGTFGPYLEPAAIEQIRPGISTKADVLR
ncbi:MAG: hypothetical protein HKP30_00655, partial [Myxococcales bacterium]|nr:hypothetical protein [Myxococcales bacterium]